MTRSKLSWAALLVLASWTVSALAAPVELRDLSQELIRARVQSYLGSDDAAKRLPPLQGQVALSESQLFYEAQNGVPQRLEWRYVTQASYDPKREAEVQSLLRDLLMFALTRHDGGLLTERDAMFLLSRTRFVAVPPPGGPPPIELTPLPPKPGAAPSHGAYPMPAPTGDRAVTPVGWPQGYDATYYSSPWYLDWATYYSWLSVYPWHHAYWPYLVYYLWANPYPIQYWWQYPWYAASWWGYPWWSYWFSPWSYTYWAYWYSPGYPFHNPYRIQFTSTSAPNRPRSADSLFSEGLQRYWNRDFAGACPLLTAAIQQRPDDARLWYFKALAERQLGDAHAPESARRGAALEFLNASDARELSLALERVQGVDRQFLRAAWTVDLTVEKAQAIARMPVQPRSVVVRKK